MQPFNSPYKTLFPSFPKGDERAMKGREMGRKRLNPCYYFGKIQVYYPEKSLL